MAILTPRGLKSLNPLIQSITNHPVKPHKPERTRKMKTHTSHTLASTQANNSAHDVITLGSKPRTPMQKLADMLRQCVIDRETEIDLIITALVARQHVLLAGSHGL